MKFILVPIFINRLNKNKINVPEPVGGSPKLNEIKQNKASKINARILFDYLIFNRQRKREFNLIS